MRTAGLVALHPSISHDEGFKILWKQYDTFIDKAIPTEDIIKWLGFLAKMTSLNLIPSFRKKHQGQQQLYQFLIYCLDTFF